MMRGFRHLAFAALLLPSLAQALPLRNATECPAPPPCNILAGLAAGCEANTNNCAIFLKTMSELELPYDCHKPKEGVGIVSAQLNQCSTEVQNKAFDVLGHSQNAEAKSHFCSRYYAQTLHGHLAEIYQGPKDEVEAATEYFSKGWNQCPDTTVGNGVSNKP